MRTVVVVGFSLAGLRAVETLRRIGYDDRLVVVGAEEHVPYDRPPLSKDLLAGTSDAADVVLRRQGLDDLALELRTGTRATALDVGARTLELDDGETLAFDGLVLATGATPRTLPGQPALDGVHTLRTLDDALAIRAALDAGARVAVVGAGFIGAEVAATCRRRGLDVAVLESLEQPMVRGLGPQLGAVCAALHRDHGVDLRLSCTVAGIEGSTRVEGVRLGDGSLVPADVVVVGIGVRPATDWLEGSGLTVADGVVADERCFAAPGVVVAGDVARWPNRLFDGDSMRVEHWTNATEQGVHAAQNLLAGDGAEAFAPVPFVWSDQYDAKIQAVGRVSADAEMRVVHGATEDRRFVAAFGARGRVVGALGFNMPRQVMQLRKLIAERAAWDHALAAATV